jgi:hypothetical protein
MLGASSAQAQGDCATAGTTGPSTTVPVDVTSTGDAAVTTCGGGFTADPDGNDFWVEFTGLTAGSLYTVNTSDNGSGVTDTVVEIWEGADCASATVIDCNADIDVGGGNFFSEASFTAQAGMRYWAFTETEFDDDANGTTWDLSIDAGGTAPANSTCDLAGTTGPATTVFVDSTLTANFAVTPCGLGADGNDFWVEFTGLTTGNIYVVSTAANGGVTDTVIQIWEGADCASATSITCDDEGGTGSFSQTSFTAQAGMRYWALTETTFGDPDGTWDLSIDAGAPPVGTTTDACDTTTHTLAPSGSIALDNTGLTNDNAALPSCGGAGAREQWVAITGLTNGLEYTATTTAGTTTDTVLEIFRGVDCASLASVGCQDDINGAANRLSEVSFIADTTGGNLYWALVVPFTGSEEGTYGLTLDAGVVPAPAPANDLCVNATVIAAGSLPFTDNTTDLNSSTADDIMNSATQGTGGGDVFYSFTPTVTASYVLTSANANNGNFNSSIGVYTGACGSLVEVDSADTNSFADESLTVSLTSGTAYTIVIEGRSAADRGVVNWTLGAPVLPPSNDDCAAAEPVVEPLPFNDVTDTTAATDSGIDNSSSVVQAGGGGLDVWYSYTPTASGTYRFTASGFDAGFAVYNTGTCPPDQATAEAAEILAVDNIGLDVGTVALTAATPYLILVEGYSAADFGLLDFTVEGPLVPPTNDDCATAENITEPLPFNDVTDMSLATDSGIDNSASANFPGPPPGGGGADVWYVYNPTVTASYQFTANGFDIGFAIYNTGSCPPDQVTAEGAELIAVDNTFGGETALVQLTGGLFYLVIVEGFSAADTGTLDFTVDGPFLPPSNDACANATVIAALPFTDNTTDTTGATDDGLNSNSFGGGGNDVWYTYTPAANETLRFDSFSTNFDESLGVHVGGCGTLTEIYSQDFFAAGDSESFALDLTGGTQYWFLLEGSGPGDFGVVNFSVALLGGSLVAGDVCATATTIAATGPVAVDSSGNANLQGTECFVGGEPALFGNDLWFTASGLTTGNVYRFTSSDDGTGSVSGTLVAAFSGPDCNTLTPVGCSGSFGGDFDLVQFFGDNSLTYFFLVEGELVDEGGTFTVELTETVVGSGDVCSMAEAGPTVGNTITVDTTGHANIEGSTCGFGSGPFFGADLWLDLGVLSAGTYSVETGDDGDMDVTDTVVAVFQGPCPGTEVACDDDGGAGLFSLATFTADGTSQYFAFVQAFGEDEVGTFNVTLAAVLPPANDLCASATVVDPNALPFSDTVNMAAASDEGTDNSASVSFGGGGGADVFYSFTPTVTADYTITADGFDLGIGVFAAPCVGAEIAAVDDTFAGEELTLTLNAGVTVLILAEAFDGATPLGTLTFTVSEPIIPSEITRPGFGWVQNFDFAFLDLDDAEVAGVGAAAVSNYIGGDFMGSDASAFFAFNATDTTLDSIDTATGAITAGPAVTGLIAPHDLPINLAWDPSTSTFFVGVADSADFAGGALGTIDPVSGAYTEIATYADATSLQCIAVDGAGNLFALTYAAGDTTGALTLQSVDKGTGALTAVGATGIGTGQFSEMDFNQGNGLLYAPVLEARGNVAAPGPNELYTIDTATGAATLVGPIQGDVTFFAFGVVGQAAGVDNWSDYNN